MHVVMCTETAGCFSGLDKMGGKESVFDGIHPGEEAHLHRTGSKRSLNGTFSGESAFARIEGIPEQIGVVSSWDNASSRVRAVPNLYFFC